MPEPTGPAATQARPPLERGRRVVPPGEPELSLRSSSLRQVPERPGPGSPLRGQEWGLGQVLTPPAPQDPLGDLKAQAPSRKPHGLFCRPRRALQEAPQAGLDASPG